MKTMFSLMLLFFIQSGEAKMIPHPWYPAYSESADNEDETVDESEEEEDIPDNFDEIKF